MTSSFPNPVSFLHLEFCTAAFSLLAVSAHGSHHPPVFCSSAVSYGSLSAVLSLLLPPAVKSLRLVLSCLLQGLIPIHSCNHHLPGWKCYLPTSHPQCLQNSNIPYQTVTSHHPQTHPHSWFLLKALNATPLPNFTCDVVLLLLFYFCHSVHSQVRLDSKNALCTWASFIPHPLFLKLVRSKSS